MIDARNALLIAAALVILVIAGLYIPYVQYDARESLSSPALAGEAKAHVRYTNRGFEPLIVKIRIGDTVEWVNESDKQMWIASDPHPSHDELPGFDQQGIVASHGGTPRAYAHGYASAYRYTFTSEGKWQYHNHLVPADRGTVVVLDGAK